MDVIALQKRLAIIRSEIAAIEEAILFGEPKFPDDRLPLISKGLCLECGEPLGKPRPRRGCHESCYRKQQRAIEIGALTDFQAVEAGTRLAKQVTKPRTPTRAERLAEPKVKAGRDLAKKVRKK